MLSLIRCLGSQLTDSGRQWLACCYKSDLILITIIIIDVIIAVIIVVVIVIIHLSVGLTLLSWRDVHLSATRVPARSVHPNHSNFSQENFSQFMTVIEFYQNNY